MKKVIRILSICMVALFATSVTYAQHGALKVRYQSSVPGAPGQIGFNQTFEKTTIYVNNPGYPPMFPYVQSGLIRYGSAFLGATTTLENPGGTYTGYTAYSTYVLTNFNIRIGGQPYYTLTPTEISNLEYAYDTIEIVAAGGVKFTIENTWDGDDTVFVVTYHL
jgi:hypothetical protein